VVRYTWYLLVGVPAIYAVIRSICVIAGIEMADVNIWQYSSYIYLVAVGLGLLLLLALYILERIGRGKEKTATIEKQPIKTAGNKQVSINVNINSGDFTNANMDTERMDKFFGSIANISGESGRYNKPQSSTKTKPKERTD
jgi:hypothetical protein